MSKKSVEHKLGLDYGSRSFQKARTDSRHTAQMDHRSIAGYTDPDHGHYKHSSFNGEIDSECENTYSTDERSEFDVRQCEKFVLTMLSEELIDMVYDQEKCKILSQTLATLITQKLKESQILPRYKLITIVSFNSLEEKAGMLFGSRCLWNTKTDNCATIQFSNLSLIVVVMVYAIYSE